ncbi:MAG: Trk system potassium transporter TrkA [Candidatus Portiera sp.]|nr:Trk system potassium transporter TrkA [Portiera sp.]
MKIIVLGAGQVGTSVASWLVKEGIDITVVDSHPDKLRTLQQKYDIRTIVGNASLPSILEAAGAADCDLLIATTSRDEVNLLACQIAYHLFKIPKRIARIREQDYISQAHLFCDTKIAVNVMINPEEQLKEYIHSSILYPSALEVMDFAHGKLKLVGIKALSGGPLVHQKVSSLREHIPNIDSRVAAIYRDTSVIMPEGDTVIEPDDEVFFLTESKHIANVMSELRKVEKDNRRVIIAGGGHIGEKLAMVLQNKHRVKIIENNRDRCEELTNSLSRTVVLNGSCVDKRLLVEENIGGCDIFCALTNSDEINIMSCLLAKNYGAKKTIALVSSPNYEEVFAKDGLGLNIDNIIDPQQVTISSILSYVRKGDVVRAHSLRHGAAEAFEVIAHGDEESSVLIGKKLEDIVLPHGVSIGALVRGNKVLMAHRNVVVEAEDHLVFFVVDKSSIEALEQLLQS